MKITIISVGKIKESFLQQGINEYLKRLGKYASMEEIIIQDEKAPDNLSDKEIDLIKEKESNQILNKLGDGYTIALEIDGINLSSIDLSIKLDEIKTYHHSHIYFIIGGSLGLSNELLNKVDYKLSFGKMTFPHQLMKLILVEQIYRSFRISNHEPYHK